jgi:hypothetical protein
MRRQRKEDDGETLRDGETGRVRLMMRDGVPVKWRDDANKYFDRPGVTVTAADGTTRGLHRPGHRVSPLAAADEREAAYRLYDQQLGEAYKKHDADPAGSYPYSQAAEGTACTINGAPGVLTKQGDVLVCVPTETQDRLTLDKIYEQFDRALSEAWRTR